VNDVQTIGASLLRDAQRVNPAPSFPTHLRWTALDSLAKVGNDTSHRPKSIGEKRASQSWTPFMGRRRQWIRNDHVADSQADCLGIAAGMA
jgi:hypothetical protein